MIQPKQTYRTYIVTALQLQTVILLIALPICVSWGLPWSLVTFIGNIVFAPAMTLLILLCALHFFVSYIGIGHFVTAIPLNYYSSLLCWILSWHTKQWLIGFAALPRPVFILIFFTSLIAIMHAAEHRTYRNAILYGMLIIQCAVFYGWTLYKRAITQNIIVNEQFYISKNEDGNFELHDFGICGRMTRPETLARYTIMPKIIRSIGLPTFTTYTTHKKNKKSIALMHELTKTCSLKN